MSPQSVSSATLRRNVRRVNRTLSMPAVVNDWVTHATGAAKRGEALRINRFHYTSLQVKW